VPPLASGDETMTPIYCKKCGGQRVVDAPPFGMMSDEEIRQWKQSGGEIVVLECPNCG
jgi:hypothetical protein